MSEGVILCNPPLAEHARAWARQYAGQRMAIFGAGPVGAALLAQLRALDANVVGVFDDFSSLGTVVDGVAVERTDRLVAAEPAAVVLATLKARQRMRQHLERLGCTAAVCCLPGEDDDIFAPPEAQRVEAMEGFRDRHLGQRALVVGNGPSLQKTDPRRIRDAVTFGCNGIFLMEGFAPDYYCVEDVLVAEDRAEQINALGWTKFFPHDLRRWLTDGNFFNGFRVGMIDRFSRDLAEGMQVNATVTYTMLQVAYYLGCDPVYLIGVDHSYRMDASQADKAGTVLTSKCDDPNHFHPDYFGKGYRWHDPRVDRMERAYELARAAYEADGRRIYNATAGGMLEVFPRVDFESVAESL